MIDFGKSQVFEGEMTQAVHGVVGGNYAPAHLVEKFADGFGVHSLTLGFSIQNCAERFLD